VREFTEAELVELAALADGTLPAERRAAVEARVAASPELQALLEEQRRALEATRALEDEPVPASLRAAVAAERRRHERRPRPRLLPVALAGALAATVAVVAAVLLSGGPAGPTVAEAARFAAEAPAASAPADGTGRAVEVDGVVFPDLRRSDGWRAVGVTRGKVDGRDATTVLYARNGSRIAYAVVAGPALPQPSGGAVATRGGVEYQMVRLDGRLVVTWRRGGHTCVLVGGAPQSELLAVAARRGGDVVRY
jgi:anti-sigma factor RsiW